MWGVWLTLFEMYFVCPCWHVRALVNTYFFTFCILPGIGWILSTHVEKYFVPSLTWERLVQYELRYILGSRWLGRDLLNTCCDEFSIRAGKGRYRQHKLRYFLSAHWHGMDWVNTC
jgi:hypothetical protein